MGRRIQVYGVKMKTQILFEDKDILVCFKPAGIAVQTASLLRQDMVSELKNYLQEKEDCKESSKSDTKHKEPYIGVIHRLDQPVSGVLVFAKNPKAAASLSEQVQNGGMEKIYRALVAGVFKEGMKERTLENYLFKDAKTNMSRIVDVKTKDAKKARLSYKVLEECVTRAGTYSKVEIKLFTGRHHQIRVQMAGCNHPILGDTKYGSGEAVALNQTLENGGLKLCAYRLAFTHPASGRRSEFTVPDVSW